MSKLRIVAKREGNATRAMGQDTRVFLLRDDGTEIDLTRELSIVSAAWTVASRSDYAKGYLAIAGVEIDAEGDFEVVLTAPGEDGNLGRKTKGEP